MTLDNTPDPKVFALAAHLSCGPSDITGGHSNNEFDYGSQSYLVLTDLEANEAAYDYILDSLWTFRPAYLATHSDVNAQGFRLDHFVADAIATDGRGHFLAQYDWKEHEVNGFYIYRVS